jgi:hypothetical protein
MRVPATWRTGTTLPGELETAMSGSSSSRSMCVVSSYVAPGSAASGVKSGSRRCARSHSSTRSSLGKTAAVSPASTIMLVIVARWLTDRAATASPVNSKTAPTPPRTP